MKEIATQIHNKITTESRYRNAVNRNRSSHNFNNKVPRCIFFKTFLEKRV